VNGPFRDVPDSAVATNARTGLKLLSFDDFARRMLAAAPAVGTEISANVSPPASPFSRCRPYGDVRWKRPPA